MSAFEIAGIAWLLLSVPAGCFFGRFIRVGREGRR